MSVPLPAILVAMVTAPGFPACAIIIDSFLCCLAFSTSCLMPSLFNRFEIYSEFSIEAVPTKIG